MRVVIVDTDVVSYLYKKDTRGLLYEPHLASSLAAISIMTVAELDQWAIGRNWGPRLYGAMLQELKSHYSVIHSSRPLCRKWAEVRESVRKSGRIIARSDAWIAATALLYDLPLITHNARHFEGVVGLNVISEKENAP
jgi:tRNA(fMet)-specific endonuclease VapC